MSIVNQKEYLKKYLGIGKAPGEKKKKKKSKGLSKGLKIVDDNDLPSLDEQIKQDLANDDEDTPQIVAVIDERPPSLRIDDERKKLWKPIGEPEDIPSDISQPLKLSSGFKLNTPPVKDKALKNRNISKKAGGSNDKKRTKTRYDDYSPRRKDVEDNSPPRQIKLEARSPRSEDNSPPRKRDYNDTRLENIKSEPLSPDTSPPRRKSDKLSSPPRNKRQDSDSSPVRRRSIDSSPPRRRSVDSSPPRKRSIDSCPPRKRIDSSPPRRRNNDSSPPRRKNVDSSPPRRRKDASSPRRRRNDDDSPPRKKNRDLSPSSHTERREKNRKGGEHRSTEREGSSRRYEDKRRNDDSPLRRSDRDDNRTTSFKPGQGDATPPPQTNRSERKSRWGSEENEEKMQKTLDGKKSGLQRATELIKELEKIKKQEDDMFKNISSDISGQNAATIVRGKKRDVEEEMRQQQKEKDMKEKYDRWGKGVKQVDDRSEKIANDLHEMNKPLARYADDEDLEKYLKEQEREGDPMLAYIRSKKKKQAVEAGIPEKPTYAGEFMPNRFGISPGYRWDGVDRSNGYEKKWFEIQNKKKANIEESYKWSTEDM